MSPNDKYADPTLDWSFKRIFLSPGHDDILKAFLNDVLQGELDVAEIQSIKGLEQTEAYGKKIIYDIHCKSKNGELFIIEIQRKEERDFFKRLDYYRGRALSEQIKAADDYEKILPVIVIAVCDFPIIQKLFPNNANVYFEKIYYTGIATQQRIPGPPHFVLLDLPQYKKQGFPTDSFLEDWFQLFTCRAIPHDLSVKRPEVKKALNDLTIDTLSSEEKSQMEVEGLKKAIMLAEMRTAIENAKNEAKRESALAMLNARLDFESIVKFSGLTLEEVKKLAKES